jgi:hypothetical protein
MNDNNNSILNLPVCGYIKIFRYFRPVPENLESKVVIKLNMPWLSIKQYILSFFDSKVGVKVFVAKSLGAFVVATATYTYHILVYADTKENKYVVEFKKESGDLFATLGDVCEIKNMLLTENKKYMKDENCDAKDSYQKFYFLENGDEVSDI